MRLPRRHNVIARKIRGGCRPSGLWRSNNSATEPTNFFPKDHAQQGSSRAYGKLKPLAKGEPAHPGNRSSVPLRRRSVPLLDLRAQLWQIHFLEAQCGTSLQPVGCGPDAGIGGPGFVARDRRLTHPLGRSPRDGSGLHLEPQFRAE